MNPRFANSTFRAYNVHSAKNFCVFIFVKRTIRTILFQTIKKPTLCVPIVKNRKEALIYNITSSPHNFTLKMLCSSN